ncbi:DUF1883 domain-containing protein [Flavobacterium sp. MFBS3-15]|uniref:DUF1883 domain-containing protein n=1 Tax=Flavobacterium sp. MFBS3-15 TaxID=2989816 RepID=UPI0022365BBF|nr:DUF1883 domain-containing protein [Flavobacterium sp. MFBS3-15]MCW4470354.1 DUF1883 domain-containing protein [Flavobacterium sp. MFBS3-15]
MKYQSYDLGQLKGGEIVEVTLKGNSANVKLMDSSNFSHYKSGRRHTFYGGHVKRSPFKIPVPRSGKWYITIDLGGYAGNVSSSVRILPGILPEARQTRLSNVPSLVQDREIQSEFGEEPIVRKYDVFISHASEDKDDIVRPLAHALQSKQLRVWYDEFELRIGDSLRQKIDKGLANSRFGIVVLSKNFIRKGWTNYELDGIITKSISGEQIVLPLWHNITKQEVMDFSPSLADKVARNTASFTIEEIADEIAEVINN